MLQDGYPLLIASGESLEELQRKISNAAHAPEVKPLVDERWRQDKLEIERYVLDFGSEHGCTHQHVRIRRFRPNIVLKGAGAPFIEDLWREILIDCQVERGLDPQEAEAARTLTVLSKCARCLVCTLHP